MQRLQISKHKASLKQGTKLFASKFTELSSSVNFVERHHKDLFIISKGISLS